MIVPRLVLYGIGARGRPRLAFTDANGAKSCASETTRLTPRSPRCLNSCGKAVQKGFASDGPMSMPSTSRWPMLLTPTAMITGDLLAICRNGQLAVLQLHQAQGGKADHLA